MAGLIVTNVFEVWDDSDSSDEETPPVYDALDHFMLTPERRRQLAEKAAREEQERRERKERREARALIKRSPLEALHSTWLSLEKLPRNFHRGTCRESLDRLNSDCLIVVMQHSKLAPDLWNLLRVSQRCRKMWEEKQRSILIGMQETLYRDYLPIFGKFGSHSDEQMQNLKRAIATDPSYQGASSACRAGFLMPSWRTDVSYQLAFVTYLQCLDRFFNRQVQRLHGPGNGDPISHQLTKDALLTLWRMSWVKPRADGMWPSPQQSDCSLDVELTSQLLNDQSSAVRSRIRDIIHTLSCNVQYDLDHMSLTGKKWIHSQELEWSQGKWPLQPYDAHEWIEEAINATVMMAIVLGGTNEATTSMADVASEMHHEFMCFICRSRYLFDQTGTEDGFFLDLKGYMEIAKLLELDSLKYFRSRQKDVES